jgi:hypothetical protein
MMGDTLIVRLIVKQVQFPQGPRMYARSRARNEERQSVCGKSVRNKRQ